MKAHYLSNREAKVARQYAAGIITKQAELAAQRAQYLWMAAMLNAGLSAKTVNRCMIELQAVAETYAACVNGEDHDGDCRLARELMARGVQVEWLPEEQ